MPDQNPPLDNSTKDYIVSAAKGILGGVPFVGSLLTEFAATIVPNQRVDRIAKFASILNERVKHLEQGFVRSQLSNENFTELLEESLRQAARSVSDERRAYISSLVASSISQEQVTLVESRHLLKVLGELNDIEILLLRAYLVPTIGGDEEFREKHATVVKRPVAYVGSPREILDKVGICDSYIEHLTQLGLLKPQYRTPEATFGGGTSSPKPLDVARYDISLFGKLLLRFVGFEHERLQPQS